MTFAQVGGDVPVSPSGGQNKNTHGGSWVYLFVRWPVSTWQQAGWHPATLLFATGLRAASEAGGAGPGLFITPCL